MGQVGMIASPRTGSVTERTSDLGQVTWIFAIALVARGFFVFCLPGYRSAIGYDNYDAIAHALLQGRGFVDLAGQSSAYRAPLYPLFLAGIYRLAGDGPLAIWILQCLLGAATACLTYVLARRFAADGYARVAGLVAALYPPLILCCGMLLSETLFIFLFLAALCLVAPDAEGLWAKRTALAGLFFGLASLARPVGFFFPLGLAAYWFLSWLVRRKVGLWKVALAMALGFFLTLAPWAIRNMKVFGTPVLSSTEGGTSLWIGMHPDPRGYGYNNLEKLEALLLAGRVKNEIDRDRFLKRTCLREIMGDPIHFVRSGIVKVCWLFNPFDGEDYGFGTRYNLPFALLMTSACFGLFLLWRQPKAGLLIYAFAYFVFIAAMLYGIPRFRLPLEPVLMVLGVAGLQRIRQLPSWRRRMLTAALWGLMLANVVIALGADWARENMRGYFKSLTSAAVHEGGRT